VSNTGQVNARTVVDVRVRGRDGKLYPASPVPLAERNRTRLLAYHLVHRDKLSISQAQRVMAGQYGISRSRGQLWRDLHDFECSRCAKDGPGSPGQPVALPEPAPEREPQPGRRAHALRWGG
jgi:hypothetical protein